MYYLEKKDRKEIAEKLNISVTDVKNSLASSRKKIKEKIAKQPEKVDYK
jgi:DNA-directed RNA polymerase specialized sigma24 family protein